MESRRGPGFHEMVAHGKPALRLQDLYDRREMLLGVGQACHKLDLRLTNARLQDFIAKGAANPPIEGLLEARARLHAEAAAAAGSRLP